jgi:hypothetical protein
VCSTLRATRAYLDAKRFVLSAGFAKEIAWQRSLSRGDLTETMLLREAAWVILSAGMSEVVVRSKFASIGNCFFDWKSASQIVAEEHLCIAAAFQQFRHSAKIKAIAQVAKIVHVKGFLAVRKEIAERPLQSLRQFPYIGPITTYHLAKNLGLSVAKPDRHLSRLAISWGYEDTHALCCDISSFIGDPIEIVDIVLWRFCAITRSSRGLCELPRESAQA